MTKDAFNYGVEQARLPEGKRLWMYGDACITHGDVYSPYHDQYSSLQQKGRTVFFDPASIPPDYSAVLVDCPKQQEETEGLVALALARSTGFVMAVAPNDAGGNRLAKIFASYGVAIQTLAKSRCKIVWTEEAPKADKAEIARNLPLLSAHQLELEGKKWWTVPGLFGWNKIDQGSKLLAEHLPTDLAGKAADFGCGAGYLSHELLSRNPGISWVDGYDVDVRAVGVAARNNPEKMTTLWIDMRAFTPKPLYDIIVMNPPFHSGKEEDIGLGEIFIRNAWASLKAGGRLFMVANRKLPYEQIVPQVKTIHEGQGYKVMSGRK